MLRPPGARNSRPERLRSTKTFFPLFRRDAMRFGHSSQQLRHSSHSGNQRPRKASLGVEQLEDRSVPSATAHISGATLQIDADPRGGSVEVTEYAVTEYATPGFSWSDGSFTYHLPMTYLRVVGHGAGGDYDQTFSSLFINRILFQGSDNAD